MTDGRPPALSEGQLAELLAGVPAGARVVLRLAVPETPALSTLAALGVDPLEARVGFAVFFDTPELALGARGLVVGARRVQGAGGEAVVTVAAGVPGAAVEVEALPDGFGFAGSLRRTLEAGAVASVLRGHLPARELFSAEQRSLAAGHAPGGVAVEDLSTLGPLLALELPFTPAGLGHPLAAVLWTYPDGSRLVELSAESTPGEALELAARLRAHLAERGLEPTGDRQALLRHALEPFAAAAAPPPKAEIVPRWEWRTFGESLSIPDAAAAKLERGPVMDGDEVYALSRHGDASVKVRDSVLDVKLLERVDDDGLEQWRPVLKAPLPLSAEATATVLDALGVGGTTDAEARDVEGLLGLVGRHDVVPVRVHKTRRRFSGAGCLAELTTLRAGDETIDSIAVESEDPAAVVALVAALGFPLEPNVSVPRGLKQLTGFGGRRVAVIDVGTNSVKFHLAELTGAGAWAAVVDRAEVTRLGEGLDGTGELQPEPLRRTLDAIAAMVDEAREGAVEEIVAVGTAGMRIASNSDELVRAVRERTGVEIEVISGEEESRLAYLAVKAGVGLADGSVVVFDTGGGSSQFTFGHGDEVEERFSVDVGAVRYTERFRLDRAVTEETLREALDAIAADFSRLDGRPSPDAMVGLGGVNTNLAAVKHELATYDPDVVQGTVLDRAEIDRQLELYRTRDADARRELVGLQPKRAEVVLAGACIVRTAMEKLGRDSLVVSDRGLRHGVLLERFGGSM